MIEKLYPYECEKSVFDIDYEKLYDCGYRGLVFDIDNTLVHHGDDATPEVEALFRRLHKMGFKTLLLSNNDEERILRFIRNIDTLYIADAAKPDPGGCFKAAEMLQTGFDRTVFIGDQIFTDILAANRSGMASILVDYIVVDERAWIGFRRYAEKLLLFLYRRQRKYRGRLYKNRRESVTYAAEQE